MALTYEQIQEVTTAAVRAHRLSWVGFKQDEQGTYCIPVLSPSDIQFARSIESAACAERDARIAELERQLAEASKDAERYRYVMDWSVRDFAVCMREDNDWFPCNTSGPIDNAMQKG